MRASSAASPAANASASSCEGNKWLPLLQCVDNEENDMQLDVLTVLFARRSL